LPIIICAGYDVPKFVNKKTLFILSSYSGNTEETLASYNLAKKVGAKIAVLTAKTENNKLVELVFKHDLPAYIFDAQYNPSTQPRLALGYAIFALVAILKQLNLIK